jgi:hypothetical protein
MAAYGQFPLALLQSGENPLWFELGDTGPALIPSPAEASLSPIIPWPLARRAAGILCRQGQGQGPIILGINREGFLVFAPWAGEEGIALYRVENSAYWKDYSVESLFFYNDTPAAMLSRNDYFTDTGLPPPSPRVWGLRTGAGMGELEIPAFEGLPPADGWDIEELQEGPDGRWYYRGVKKSGARGGIGYFRTTDLSLAGEPSSPAAQQNASQPRAPEQAPAPLRQVLEAALASGEAGSRIAGVVSPEFASLRYYASALAMKNIREDVLICPGYYRSGRDGAAIALIISPAGQGFIGIPEEDAGGSAQGNAPGIREFALPPLPQGFAYTGIACFVTEAPGGGLSLAVLGTWEEQDGWNVGAAGFVLVGLDVLD